MSTNLASATNIGGSAAGYFQATNAAVTGPDYSVWYYWTCPATGYYVFDTMFEITASPPNPLATTIAAYLLSLTPHSPVQMSDLTPMAYVAGGNQPNGASPNTGALVAFSCTAASVYYIQVNARFAYAPTGNYGFHWGGYAYLTLGACGTCTPANTQMCQVGSITMGDVTDLTTDLQGDGVPGPTGASPIFAYYPPAWAQGSTNLGSLPSGYYYLIYCGGAIFNTQQGHGEGWGDGNGTTPVGLWVLYSLGTATYAGNVYFGSNEHNGDYPANGSVNTVSFSPGQIVATTVGFYLCTGAVTYPAGTPWSIDGHNGDSPDTTNWTPFSNYADLTGTIGYGQTSQQQVEQDLACRSVAVAHTGGNMIAGYIIQTANNSTASIYQNGSPNPTYAIFLFQISQQIIPSVHTISNNGASGGGYNYSVTLTLRNGNLRFPSSEFSLALNNALDVSSASAMVTGLGISANGTMTATFTFFSASTDELRGQFQFYNFNGDPDGPAFTLVLASAAWSIEYGIHAQCSGSCTDLCLYSEQYNVTNVTQIPLSNVALTITAPAALFTTAYVDTNGQGTSASATTCAKTPGTASLTVNTGPIPYSGSASGGLPNNFAYVHFGIVRNGATAPTSQVLTIASVDGAFTVPHYTRTLAML